MGLISRFSTFVDGKTDAGKITAERLNGNFDTVYNAVNGNLEDSNIKAGAKVLCSDRDYLGANKITGNHEYLTFPLVPNASIPDGKLSANVPLKDQANTFTGKPTFDGGVDMNLKQIEKLVCEQVANLPAWDISYRGRVLYCLADNKFYGANATEWKQLDYIGGYTGGAVSRYTYFGELDDGDGIKLLFKTEGANPTVKIVLWGEPYPQRHYTELPYHTHTFEGIAHNHPASQVEHFHTTTMGSHGHGATQYSISTHTHGVSGNTGNQSASHTHDVSGPTGAPSAACTIGGSTSHTHPVNLTSGIQSANHLHAVSLTTGAPSGNQQIQQTDLGNKDSNSKAPAITVDNQTAGGTNTHAGVQIGASLATSQKLYAKNLTVKIDGTNVTANVLAATGWGAIGDGTGTHAFHVNGTGEMDASAWKAYAAGFHTLEVLEPEAEFGTGLKAHLEIA